MSTRPFHLRYEELPEILPVFPLSGALLLPEGRLPLNVFEPRYLAMVEDALGAKRLIGMIQPTESPTGGVPTPGAAMIAGAEPALYETGCAGRIASFAETQDGRLMITLAGVSRFKVTRELESTRGYRRVAPDWSGFRADLEPPVTDIKIDRAKLLSSLRAYLSIN